jgi:hypothetical protein
MGANGTDMLPIAARLWFQRQPLSLEQYLGRFGPLMLPFWAEHLCFHSPTSKTSNFKHEYGSFLPKSAFLTQIHSKAIFKTERLWFRTAQICFQHEAPQF